jgi:hypothetical protein
MSRVPIRCYFCRAIWFAPLDLLRSGIPIQCQCRWAPSVWTRVLPTVEAATKGGGNG